MAPPAPKPIASNRRAHRDYDILDVVEAGIVLRGSEVKSLRLGTVQIAEAFARQQRDGLWLDGMHIPPYSHAAGVGAHLPDNPRKLLLHAAEINRLMARVNQEHLTLIPLSLYFKDGRVKVELALVKGRTKGDKRQALAKADAQREIRDQMGRRNKG